MHKNIKNILHLGLILTTLMLCFACSQDDEQHQQRNSSFVEIVGRVPGFTDYDVTTRAAKNQAESEINLMTLMIFDNAGTLINMQHIESSVPLFIIDRYVLSQETANGITAADMYMIANVQAAVIDSWNITTKAQLLEKQYALSEPSLDIPANGFPMVGAKEDVNLDPNGTIEGGKIEINLENLYAKVVFNIKLESTQSYFDPTFQLVDWEVHNLPQGVALFEEGTDGQTVFYNNVFDSELTSRRVTGSNPLQGSNTLSFSFYMPEHKVNPGTTSYAYPDGISDNEKQRYKPCLVEDIAGYDGKPVYVVLNGIFTNHQNHRYEVNYKVYLGADNWQNFQIDRNGQYNNSIVIRGITNSSTGTDGISVDHRVNVSYSDFIVQMERETLLDSHIEVRPVQINIPQKDGVTQSVKVYLADAETSTQINRNQYQWVRFEAVQGAMNSNKYCSYTVANQKNKGRRKYFTTDLLTELNNTTGNGIQAEFTEENNSLWIYFDENTNASNNGVRKIALIIEYYENGSKKSSKEFMFQQHDLYPVIFIDEEAGKEYRYDIEYYEEYLYNFNSDDDFNATRAGMPWGPKTIISDEILAIQDIQNAWTDYLPYIETAIKNAGGYYDFQNNFWGRKYTTKLIDIMNQEILTQDAMPESAAQHCHNKNKRNADGEVETINWYLPAIGELQHIMSAAYTKFEMFQDNRYWSSQTSYRIGHFKYNLLWGWLGSVEGDYYYEDQEYARATKAIYEGNNIYTYEPSEVEGISKTWNGSISNQTGSFTQEVAPTSRDSGNQLRDAINRVRAVRNKFQRNIGATTWQTVTEE